MCIKCQHLNISNTQINADITEERPSYSLACSLHKAFAATLLVDAPKPILLNTLDGEKVSASDNDTVRESSYFIDVTEGGQY